MTNGERIDGLARALAAPNTRRRAVLTGLGLVGGAGVIAAWRQPASSAQSTCITAGNPCSLGATCCDGSYCASTSLFNPNVGVCTQGSAPESPDPAPTPTKAPRPTRPANTPSPNRKIQFRLQCTEAPNDDQLAEDILEELIIVNGSNLNFSVRQLKGFGSKAARAVAFMDIDGEIDETLKLPVQVSAGSFRSIPINPGPSSLTRQNQPETVDGSSAGKSIGVIIATDIDDDELRIVRKYCDPKPKTRPKKNSKQKRRN